MKSDEALRVRVKFLQSKDASESTLLEMDELVDGLRITESKLLYQKEILGMAYQRALDEQDMKLSAKFFVASLIVDSIIGVYIMFNTNKSIIFKLKNILNT